MLPREREMRRQNTERGLPGLENNLVPFFLLYLSFLLQHQPSAHACTSQAAHSILPVH